MNEIVVCTYCDRAGGMLEEYRDQLHRAGIAVHVETIVPFPDPASLPLSFKLHWMRTFATNLRHTRKLVFTDAYDVLFVGNREDAIDRIPDEVIWGAERNCYPEPHLAELISGDTPWKYVNAGLMAGSPEAILDWVADAERHPQYEPGPLDQCWLNRRRADTPSLVPLDSTTSLFYVMSAWLEGGELQAKDNRPWNSLCDTYPAFIHFSGKCRTDSFRELLAYS
jgi:hypothetical protein